jgi:hypothetical protein
MNIAFMPARRCVGRRIAPCYAQRRRIRHAG